MLPYLSSLQPEGSFAAASAWQSKGVKTETGKKTEADWKRDLTPTQYHVLREKGTERPFTGEYWDTRTPGAYLCAGCGVRLFESETKFDAHCGWPSFYDPANAKNVISRDDYSHGSVRTEVICARCGGHLGHVFKGEGFKTPTDLRYCINGVSLKFVPADGTAAEKSKTAQP